MPILLRFHKNHYVIIKEGKPSLKQCVIFFEENKNIEDTSIIGYEKGYEKENILNNTTFNFGDLLASVFYYAIVQISNKSCAEEIKEISKDFVDGFRTSTEEIYFCSPS